MPNPTNTVKNDTHTKTESPLTYSEPMPNLLKQHHSFLFSTDLEPDDIFAFLSFMQQLEEQARHNPLSSFKTAFLVGEYESGIKVARMEKLITLYKNSFDLPSNINLSVLPGYSDFTGSQKQFAQDGAESLTEAEIKVALEEKSKLAEPEKLAQICEYLEKNPNTLVISLKPMRELLDLEPQL